MAGPGRAAANPPPGGQPIAPGPLPSAPPQEPPPLPSAPSSRDIQTQQISGQVLSKQADAKSELSYDINEVDVTHYRTADSNPEYSGWYRWIPFVGWIGYGIKCWINNRNLKEAEEKFSSGTAGLDEAIKVANPDIRNRYLLMRAKELISKGNVVDAGKDLDQIQPTFQKKSAEYWALRAITDFTKNKKEASADLSKIKKIYTKQQLGERPIHNLVIWSQKLQAKITQVRETDERVKANELTEDELDSVVYHGSGDKFREANIKALCDKIDQDTLSETGKKLKKLRAQYSQRTIQDQLELFNKSLLLLVEDESVIQGSNFKDIPYTTIVKVKPGLRISKDYGSFIRLWMPGDQTKDVVINYCYDDLRKNLDYITQQAQNAFDSALALSNQASAKDIKIFADQLLERSIKSLLLALAVVYNRDKHDYKSETKLFVDGTIKAAQRNFDTVWSLYQKISLDPLETINLMNQLINICCSVKTYEIDKDEKEKIAAPLQDLFDKAQEKRNELAKKFSEEIDGYKRTLEKSAGLNPEAIAKLERFKDFDPTIMVFIAKCYANGWGVRKNLFTALQYFNGGLGKNIGCEAGVNETIQREFENVKSGGADPSSKQESFKFLEEAAKTNPLAKEHLADCYLNGYGVKRDVMQAYDLYASTNLDSSKNKVNSMLQKLCEGLIQLRPLEQREGAATPVVDEQEQKIAIAILEKAQTTFPQAAYWLGEYYLISNKNKAQECYERAATAKDPVPKAQWKLANLLATGINEPGLYVAPNYKSAQEFYEKAAKAPSRDVAYGAQCKLAELFEERINAQDKDYDYLQLLRAYKKASDFLKGPSEKGQPEMKIVASTEPEGKEGEQLTAPGTTAPSNNPLGNLEKIFGKIFNYVYKPVGVSAEGVGVDERRLEEELKIQGMNGNVLLGRCYEEGLGVDMDLEKAKMQYLAAAQNGNAEGQYLYAICLRDGKGGSKDAEAARVYCRKAIEQQYQPAIADKRNFGIA